MIKSSTNVRSSWYKWFSTQQPIRMRIMLGCIRAGDARVKCKNCLTMAGTGNRNPIARCYRVKNTPLCSKLKVDSSDLFTNWKLMLSGTSQYLINSSIVRDEMMLLAEGVARVRSPGRPLVEVSSWPLAILLANQKEKKRQILNSTPNQYKGMPQVQIRATRSRQLLVLHSKP